MNIRKRDSKSERTRQFIIEQVAPIFNKKGFSGTSLSDLTEATKLTKGAIYGNFKNKDEIAVEAFKYNLSLLVGTLNSELIYADSPLEKLFVFTKVFRKLHPKIISIGGCPLLNAIVDSDDTHALMKEISTKALKGFKNNLESIISDGIQNKQIKPEVDADTTAVLFLTLIEGGFLMSMTMNNKKYFDKSLDQMEKIITEIKL